jgi:transcriptional regulator with XRE-family HTH domain
MPANERSDDKKHASMGKPNRKPSTELRRRVADNLKALREAEGHTQRQLGVLCGFSNTFVSNIEQGTCNVTLATLEALSHALDCTEADLLMRRSRTDDRALYSSEKSSFCG